MDDNQYTIDEIRKFLHNSVHPCYDNTSKTHVYCRCPECGDSKKNKLSAHFYIEMKPPFLCYCQKCGFTGQLNQEMLNKLQVFDNNLLLNISTVNKTIKENQNISFVRKSMKFDYFDDENDDVAKSALSYFNARFAGFFDLKTLNETFKCVCNPKKFLEQNHVDLSKQKFDFSKAIGFVSSDNKYIICRDTTGQQSIRYSNMALTNDSDKSKIYNIRTPVSLLADEVTLVITEGIFDCIGVYNKFYKNSENIIVAAACGKSYERVINKFIEMGFLNLKIQIYSDTDVNINSFKDLKRNSIYLKNTKIEVFYNTLGKDCGVAPDQIEVTKTII